jgi:starvation-inducible outer membrane lipoprotein
MCSGNRVRASLVITGLCVSLTLGLSACSSVPIREELYGGDNRNRAPVHQEKMRERRANHG